MAYQNVNIPRFYVDYLQYYKALGKTGYDSNGPRYHYYWNAFGSIGTQEIHNSVNNLISLNPSYDHRFSVTDPTAGGGGFNYNIAMDSSFPVQDLNMVGILGHNFATTGGGWRWAHWDGTSYPQASLTNDIVINGTHSTNTFTPTSDGFSFCSCNGSTGDTGLSATGSSLQPHLRTANSGTEIFRAPTLFWGRTYTMSNTPDLRLKMSIEMDGVKVSKTPGGTSLTNINYRGPSSWGGAGAWQFGTYANLRGGRRVWDLSFSYLNASDIMPNLGVQNYDGATTEDILSGTDFFSEVINKTMGNHLPFIFQPDSENNNPDQFAICRFDMDSFIYEQVSPNVYNVNLKIRECW